MKLPKITLGGPPAYVSVAAARLGAKVSVISKVGNDFPNEYYEWLQNNGVYLSALKRVSNASTTRFIIEYKRRHRKLRLEARAPPILPTDIPNSVRSTIVHVAPIANEISSEVVEKLRKSAKILSLDPQGFLRSFDEEGNVHLKTWLEPEALAKIDVFKSTLEEIRIMTGVKDLKTAMTKIGDHGVKMVIVTRGVRGSTVFFDDNYYAIPACKPKTVVDPTGAGDAYIGAFLAEYGQGKKILWCACVGSAAASFVIEGIGAERFGERHEVYERARKIYQKNRVKEA
jgi:sugar/nucleoside kinase (ribokinase family)